MGIFEKLPCFSGKSSGDSASSSLDEKKDITQAEAGGGNRAQWASPTEFMLTCIGYSVGLGNVWRFPYLCYKSGGGAFLIPYIIMICLIGMPLLFMEYAFGQFFGIGSLSIFKKVCPMFQGIGIGYVVVNALVCIYYNVIIALTLYYLFASFTKELPWGTCGNEWNTAACGDAHTEAANHTLFGNDTMFNGTLDANITAYNGTRSSPSDEYFRLKVLDMRDEHSIENLGRIQPYLCLCLLLAWILVICFVSRGIKSTGKVAYFTATFPYMMLTVLVVRGVTLPGADKGIIYFVKPVWSRLREPKVWYAAATQLFYSTNLAWGGMITMASYNAKNHKCFRDAIMINIVSFCTSLYAGFAVFSIIGYMADKSGEDIDQVIKSGPGLAFVVYPRALSLMPLSQLWSVLFFFMLFLLGIGSQMVLIETVVTGFVDEFPRLGINAKIRLLTTISVAVLFCALGIPSTTQGGMYVLQLMDHYSAGFNVLMIAVLECFIINWIYGMGTFPGKFYQYLGVPKFASNVKEMLGKYPHIWWRLCWQVISPLLIFGILIFSLIEYTPAEYGSQKYPFWADAIGWCMALASIIPIIAVAIYKLTHAEGNTLREKWENATSSIEVEDHRICSIEVKESTELNDVTLPLANDVSVPVKNHVTADETKEPFLEYHHRHNSGPGVGSPPEPEENNIDSKIPLC